MLANRRLSSETLRPVRRSMYGEQIRRENVEIIKKLNQLLERNVDLISRRGGREIFRVKQEKERHL